MHLYVLLDVKFEDANERARYRGRMVDVDQAFFFVGKGLYKGIVMPQK